MMRIVVTGATGNVGTSVLRALAADPEVSSIVGLARRAAAPAFPRTELVTADVARDDLVPILRGADVVIHLAWLIQPGRDESLTRAVNVDGTRRVIEAVLAAGVPSLVHASSVGAYAPGPKDRAVDEAWPTTGIPGSFYSRHKARAERLLDELEAEQPKLRVVRLRPGLIFQAAAATEIRRLFVGPFVPRRLLDRALIPVVPRTPGLRFQAVHADDVGEAYRLAARSELRGAFNIAADPVIGAPELAEVLGARPVPVPAAVLRGAAAGTYALRLQPTEPGWVDLALKSPLMDTGRARDELGWVPRRSGTDALAELLDAMRRGEDFPTPPLAAATSGPLRVRELLTGIGRRP
jgi:UDP-glucose 4-epimerase